MPKGYLMLLLHAHLPYVHHPEYDSFLEERWFYEAMTETYLPLVKVFDNLIKDNVGFRITVSLSPSLLSMMQNKLLQKKYEKHLCGLKELSEKELERTRQNPHFHYLAQMYNHMFNDVLDIYVRQYKKDIISAFKRYHRLGHVELITTSSTHAILPLFASHPRSVEAQIRNGYDYFESIFGFRPDGMWLPECGFYNGLEGILKKEDIKFFFTETHGIENASVTPFYCVYAPVYTHNGIAAFGRDRSSTKQVWSAREGYPGDPVYREFYRDIGYDLDFDYIRPYIAGDVRVDTGIKYYRITGPTSWKEAYHPQLATERAAQHAGDFLHKRVAHIEYLESVMETAPVIVAPFDAELFGHWWFEGPQWLDFFIRKTFYDQDTVELITPTKYLRMHPVHQVATPCSSTWGHKGTFQTWINEKNDWIYPQLHECCLRMKQIASRHAKGRIPVLTRRVLNQCVRELFLAQSSDWPFMINNGTSEVYATRRVKDHIARFHYLINGLEKDSVDSDILAAIEKMDDIFPDVDYKLFV